MIKLCNRCGCKNYHNIRRNGKPQSWCKICCQLHGVWRQMVQRCTNKNHPRYKDYGARGIFVDEKFLNFSHFLSHIGPRPTGYTLERIDNNNGYVPGNIKWASPARQSRNKRCNIKVTHNGETLVLKDWAAKLGIKQQTLSDRYKRYGNNPEKLFHIGSLAKSATPEIMSIAIQMHKTGDSCAKIGKLLGFSRVAVYKWIKKYQNTGEI